MSEQWRVATPEISREIRVSGSRRQAYALGRSLRLHAQRYQLAAPAPLTGLGIKVPCQWGATEHTAYLCVQVPLAQLIPVTLDQQLATRGTIG